MGRKAGGRSAQQRRINRQRHMQLVRRMAAFARREGASVVTLGPGGMRAYRWTEPLRGEQISVVVVDER